MTGWSVCLTVDVLWVPQMLSMVAGWLQLGSLAFMLFGSKVSHRQPIGGR